MTLVLIGAGGFFGAITRYLVDGWVATSTGGSFPWGTLVVNVTGSFVLGLLFAASVERGLLPAAIRAPVLIGFIGAYTTFSTFMVDADVLAKDGHVGTALVYLVASLVTGLAAVTTGVLLTRAALARGAA